MRTAREGGGGEMNATELKKDWDGELLSRKRLKVVPPSTVTLNSRLMGLHEILTIPPVQYLIPGFLPEVGVAVMFGPSGTCKTFIALDWAMRVARGDAWRDLPVKCGAVVYVAAEGKSGFGQRVRSWLAQHANHDAEPTANIHLLAEPIDFISDTDLPNEIRQLSGKPQLIVLDTLSQTLSGDENSNRDMAAYVRRANLLANEFQCLVLIVHHCGKADASDPRGGGAIKGNVDAMFNVKPGVLGCQKLKDGKEPGALSFKLVPVDGESSCVIEWGDALPESQASRPKPRGLAQELIWGIASSKCQQSTRHKNNKPVVNINEVAAAFQTVRAGKKGCRSYFDRAFDAMKLAGLMHVDCENDVFIP